MTNDARNTAEGVCRSIKHFDNYTREHKLTPHRDMEVDASTESDLNALQIQKFLIAPTSSSVTKLYGLGIKSGKTQVYSKTTTPGASWLEAAGTSSTSSSSPDTANTHLLFVYYQKYIYGANDNGSGQYYIWRYGDIEGTATFAYNYYDLTGGSLVLPTANGLVHSKDDILYVPCGNKILSFNVSTPTVALTLPTKSTIVSICEYGNYLAIACNNVDGSSTVYLWDRDSTLTTLSEKMDWGTGSIKLIESIGGVLCGISSSSIDANTGIDYHVYFKYWSGSQVIVFEDFTCDSLPQIGTDKQKFNNLFYFLGEMVIKGVVNRGLWKIYKKADGRMTISFDRLPRNDAVLDGTTGELLGFYRWGDYVFIAYKVPSSGAYTIWRTATNATYTATSVIETTINPNMSDGDRIAKKQLQAVVLASEPLTSGQQLVLKYRVDNTTAGGGWTTIFTQTTTGTVVTEAIKAGSTEFTTGREYEFRIDSTGGAEPTELLYKYEIKPTLI